MTSTTPKHRLRRGLMMAALVLPWGGETIAVRAEEIVGAVGAANAGPTARAPNKSQRSLKPGDDVFFKDRIATGRGGSAQITLLDRSTLNVGENSEIVIDEFVYNPGTASTMRARLNHGMMRYVGGDISHGGGATVETPVVTIGIRGGIGTIGYVRDAASIAMVPGVPRDFKGGTIVIDSYGIMTVRNATSETVIRRPGFAVFVDSSATTIATPVRLEAASIAALMKTIGSQKGQNGGASAAARQKARIITSVIGTTIDTPATAVSVPAMNALDYTRVFTIGNAYARVQSQARQAVQLVNQLQAAVPVASTRVVTPVTPVVPAPSTPATTPVTPIPVVTAPSAPAATPVTAIPVVTAPVTPATTPVTAAPVVTAPSTPAATPVTAIPVVTAPSTPATTPVTAIPVVTAPSTPATTPVTAIPVVTAPATPAATPATAIPVVTAPATPAATPVTAIPVVTAPATPAATPVTAIPVVTAPSTPATTPVTATPVVTAPSTPAATPVTATVVVTAPATPATTPVTATVVVTVPSPLGHDNGKGNNFSNNGQGNLSHGSKSGS